MGEGEWWVEVGEGVGKGRRQGRAGRYFRVRIWQGCAGCGSRAEAERVVRWW